MELDHKGLVLRPDRANREGEMRLHSRMYSTGYGLIVDIGDRLSFVRESCNTTRASSATILFRRSHEWVDIDLFDPPLLDDQLAEANKHFFKLIEIDCGAPAKTFQRGVNLRSLHQPPCQCPIERRKPKCTIFKDFDKISAGAE